MAVYDLERFSVLLVEDNLFVRNTLEEVLRQFRIPRIELSRNDEEAIAYLRGLKERAEPAPELILSDLVMAPINGLLLLRWARSAKESPNRFVPFIMISGAADREYVESSRDLGVTEFLAKPFSAASVYNHLLKIIDRPRQFVATQKYFGPDRRRRAGSGVGGKEHRRGGEDHVTVVYSADKAVKPKQASDVWHFRLPNRLKELVGGKAGSEGELPMALLEEAEQKLERTQLDFTSWALDYLKNLSELCEQALTYPQNRGSRFADIHLVALELRGQGGTFGYPLITQFAKMLYDATNEGCPTSDSQVEIVKAHIDAMRAVIRDKVAGDGGEIGRALLKGLHDAVERHQMVD